MRTQSPPDGAATSATTVALDYVQLLLDALAARGSPYEIVAQSINFDIELPRNVPDLGRVAAGAGAGYHAARS